MTAPVFQNRELRIPSAQNDVCKVKESKCVKDVDESYPCLSVFTRNDRREIAVGKVVRIAASRPFGGARPVRKKLPAPSKARSDWKSHVEHYGSFEVDLAAR